uniref:Uncharacterized protein n=1 Tax=Klebsiella pneumoniae TaxID=573 RepID=A0A8B0ST16_KLEPN|nr:hypothetical protein [Klebsiella pneumoniae]
MLESIADEAFEPRSLDYFNCAGDEEQMRVRLNYQSYVISLGLTCSDEKCSPVDTGAIPPGCD